MHIHSLYIHPIKSLLPVSLKTTTFTTLGFPHDRTFLLQRLHPTPEVLFIGRLSTLCLFAVSLNADAQSITVTFNPSGATLEVPLVPPLGPEVDVTIYSSSCRGHHVSDAADAFFTTALGFETRLIFLGAQTRTVLGNVGPTTPTSLLSRLGFDFAAAPNGRRIGFTDCAPLLVTSQASLDEVSRRVGRTAEMIRFRPNVVVALDEGEEGAAFEEDFWGELELGKVVVTLTANCARCQSLNVDFETGGFVSPEQQPLKHLMKDRRVDLGMKSPVFGRYGFSVDDGEKIQTVSVGDPVKVTKVNKERTVFYWPGLSVGTRNK